MEEWIARHAVPLTTVEAGNGFADLRAIGEMVGDARIVSLGEPTHGNREVFQLKHRLVEYLVEEKGFTLFALECPFGEAFDVNRYILGGEGTAEEALAGLYYWTWDTREFVDLLQWMRAYNADPAHPAKIKFYGIDMQDPERSARRTLEYLREVDPDLWASVAPALGILQIQFSDPIYLGRRPYIPRESDARSVGAMERVSEALDHKKDTYVRATSLREWALARQYARQVERYLAASRNDGERWEVIRDKTQAENIQWALDAEGDSSKLVVWAHNCHVSNSVFRRDVPMHGRYLRQLYGDQLKILGLFFDQGSFRALDVNEPSRGMRAFTVGAAPAGTLEHTLASAQQPLMALDMHALPDSGRVHAWFHAPHPTRHSGAGYHDHRPEDYLWPYIPAEAFDVLVYLERTTPVVPVDERVYAHLWLLDPREPAPANLDFEAGDPAAPLPHWTVWSKFARLGVTTTVTDANPYAGQYAARLHRPPGVSFGEITPNLTQRIDATPYRGRRILIRAAARARVEAPGFAFFRATIDPATADGAHDGLPPLFDSHDRIRIAAPAWTVYEIEATVPASAGSITYGVYLRDPGTVWMDAVSVEVR